jgi:hypothetical protein
MPLVRTTRRRAELRGGFLRLIAVSRAVRQVIELICAHEALVAEGSYGPFGPMLLPNGPDATHR